MTDDSTGQSVYPEFVKDLLASEDKRRESLESRGMSVITVSGTLVTLLLGLAALVTKRQDFVLPGTARNLVMAAVVVFVLAALLAMATYAPQSARITDPADLARALPKVWDRGVEFARQKTTMTRLEELAAMQRANDLKARALLSAVIVQVVAVLLLAASVIVIL